MSACEKCWSDAWGEPGRYRELSKERKDNPCSPEEHAGEFARMCPVHQRMTIHQNTGECLLGSGERQ